MTLRRLADRLCCLCRKHRPAEEYRTKTHLPFFYNNAMNRLANNIGR